MYRVKVSYSRTRIPTVSYHSTIEPAKVELQLAIGDVERLTYFEFEEFKLPQSMLTSNSVEIAAMAHKQPTVYTIEQFLETYKISRTSMYRYVNSGELKIVKLGRRTLIRRKDAENWLKLFLTQQF